MLARREALESAGLLDERFFIYSEETDLCLRMRRAGWEVCHLPSMTILHHAGKAGSEPKMVAQYAFARLQYAHKHFSPAHRIAYIAAVYAQHLLRAVSPRRDRRIASRRAMRVLCVARGRRSARRHHTASSRAPTVVPPPHSAARARALPDRCSCPS